MTAFIRGMDDIAIVCVCGYTANSIGEKGINGYFYNRNSSTNDSSDNG